MLADRPAHEIHKTVPVRLKASVYKYLALLGHLDDLTSVVKVTDLGNQQRRAESGELASVWSIRGPTFTLIVNQWTPH